MRLNPLLFLILLPCAVQLTGCPEQPDDDDSAVGDDDDATADDDDATADDDDATADDDDSGAGDDDDDSAPAGCPAEIQAVLDGVPGWAETTSCGNAAFFSIAPGGTAHLGIGMDLSASEIEIGSTFTLAFGFEPKDQVPGIVLFETGTNVADSDCDDALKAPTTIDTAWSAVAGSATLTVDSMKSSEAYDGSIVTSGILLANDDGSGETCALPDGSWSGLYFGWFPG